MGKVSDKWQLMLIIGIVVVVCLAVVFLVSYIAFGIAKRNEIRKGLEDEFIRRRLELRISEKGYIEGITPTYCEVANSPSLLSLKKIDPSSEILVDSKSKKNKVNLILLNVFCYAMLVVSLVFFGLGIYASSNHGLVSFNGTSFLTIESDSMSEANNRFAKNFDDQIDRFSLIAVHQEDASKLEPGKIVAFYDDDLNMIIVHRIIRQNMDGTYQTMGDKNLGSMASERRVKSSQIKGVYEGENYGTGWGMFISYMRAPVGWAALVSFSVFLIGYSVIDDKLDQAYSEREKVLLPQIAVYAC